MIQSPVHTLLRSRPLAALPRPTVIVYSVGPDLKRECEQVATELGIGRIEVKHLQAACAALAAHPRAFVVASVAIKSWDRHVLQDHADRAGATLRWVDEVRFDDAEVAAVVRTWALQGQRAARTGR